MFVMEIREQVVLVTGSSRGLGAAIAKAFAREGASVVVNYYKSEEKAQKLSEELGRNSVAIRADVRDFNQVASMFEEAKKYFGKPVTTIVNNALIDYVFDPMNRKTPETIEWEDYLKQLEGAVKGALNTIKAGLKDMKKMRFGRIINIGTNLFQNPVVPYHDYTTAKAALIGFTRNMAKELGEYGITVNMVSGGLLKVTDASSATSKEVFDLIEQTTPLKKVTAPEDLADVVLFFASPWARAVTGQNLVVDGGLVMD
jgi:3-oxoacyl-[acyl-carrier protein] reductase